LESRNDLHKILLVVTLTLVMLQPISQNVSAVFFDPNVTLRLKADPGLRTVLGQIDSEDDSRVGVLLVFSEVPSAEELDAIRSIGNVETFTGHVATIYLPRHSLPQLAALSFVERISMPKVMRPELDISVPEILANEVWDTVRDPEENPINGSGVVIGVLDTGIDYLHRDFFFENGTNKILYIWDQSVEGKSPNGYDYGNECTTLEIEIRSCSEQDTDPTGPWTGHGTAVAAVAASTGQASGKYLGVAPGASIIAVKLYHATEEHVVDGINYIVSKAREVGRPLVINYSFGDSLGSHDGTEPLELAMTDFAAQGVPIVVASGNSRDVNLHVSGELRPGQTLSVSWSIDEGQTQSYVDVWYPLSDFFAISLKTPSGQVVSGPTVDSGISTPDGNVIILADQRETGKEWWINVTSPEGKVLQTVPWSFTLTGVTVVDGKWDAWTEPGMFTTTVGTMSRSYSIDPEDTIDHPGTARGVITVGGYMTRLHWKAGCSTCKTSGTWFFRAAAEEGDLTYSSGAGPTRDGRKKPEITAPSASIATAKAFTKTAKDSDPDNYHQMWRGTSFSVPHVAGVIALMLQMNPYLSPNEIKDILKDTARQDKFTGEIDPKVGSLLWGWGKVNALNSTLDATRLYAVRVEISSVGEGLKTNLSLDGRIILTMTLNSTRTIILEFTRGGNHTIELTREIQVGDGVRYVVRGTPWTFSAGGTRSLQYQLQFYLRVVSAHGYATGSGWYDANSTAVASIASAVVEGYEFRGWTGSLSSTSPTVKVSMNSSKQLIAQWEPPGPPVSPRMTESPILSIVVIAAVAIIAASVLLTRFRRRSDATVQPVLQHPS